MTPREEAILTALEISFPGDEIRVEDFAGDQEHFTVTVISSQFEGVGRVNRQKMAVKALGSLAQEIHAFQYKLQVPE